MKQKKLHISFDLVQLAKRKVQIFKTKEDVN